MTIERNTHGRHPTFAIVGHPNKGKSSIVATLAEDETVAISPDPGTTRVARSYRMRVDDQVLYELVDTPGFQRPRAVLDWLRRHERGADARPQVVREFIAAHAHEERYRNEIELLRPILTGAGVLYVVDGAHPYGPEYEPEMEVLRWTGQPRMALINMIGPGDYVDEWRRALNQYFSIVRVFDAQRADFSKRLELLRAFRELGEGDERFTAALDHAVRVLEAERDERRRRAASEIADLLIDVLSWRETASLPEHADQAALVKKLSERLMNRVRQRERAARRVVQELYHHSALETQESAIDILSEDVFSERSFVLFGLSTKQLAMTGAATGAVAGSVIDAAVGGASLLLGAGVGALLGGVGAVFGANRLAKVRVFGTQVGGMQLQVGPIATPNFPWVILGRAMLHHRLVAERNHARREALVVDAASGTHLSESIEPNARRRMARAFERIREDGGLSASNREQLCADIEASLEGTLTGDVAR
ncbi:MAG: DUF3482 domain-containing protein [Gammaproteobacteria bacterium]|mgnify:CR=1 FL=1